MKKKRKPTRRGHPPAVESESSEPFKRKLFPIVGIGASAGGLEAFKQLLQHLPKTTGMGYVLVQHLAPRHESALTELLSRSIHMPITEVREGMAVEPDHVYVIPPNSDMAIQNGTLHLVTRTAAHGHHMPIDYFLHSLAADCGNKAIGVILSGTASDGTLGMKAIKAEGGITFAQDEKSAKYPEMPRNAVGAGCVDFVLNPAGIVRELRRIGNHPYLTQARLREAAEPLPEGEDALKKVFILLRNLSGVNFALYKHTTIKRRMRRRMVLHKVSRPKDYLRFLQENPAELNALYEDILIHVTGFFRDPESYDALKKNIFPVIMSDRRERSPIRIWVPGCSSGEEVYSIAICLMEFLGEKVNQTPVQCFATDISESAIERARSGIYLENISADVSPGRLRRFFVKVEHGFQIIKAIREMCVFARHDVTKDPPFSRLDLISCRNLLIYLGPVLQKKVLPLFAYGLKPKGFLLLGTSETIPGFDDHFTLIDKKCKIYSRKQTPLRGLVEFGAAEARARSEKPLKKADEIAPGFDVLKEADRILLSKYVPAGVIINEDLEILQFRGRTGPFLEPAPGQASLSLPKMAREGLLIDLRAAIHQAKKQNTAVRKEGIPVKSNGRSRLINLEAIPIQGPLPRDRYFLLLFEETPPAPSPEPKGARARREFRARKAEDRQTAGLKDELANTKASLQSIIEEQETSNEELRSANEEILSSNEELQSTNEELETAKEELESANEELTTLNEESQNRNLELSVVNDDLKNLFASVNIPVVMVGSDLRIRRFTPVAEKIFNIIPSDAERPIGDLRPNLDIPDIEELIASSIDTITSREQEVQDREGRWYSLRVRPYRTVDNKIDGAILTLLDIDALKAEVNESRLYATSIVESVRTSLLVLDSGLRVRTANRAFYELFRMSREDVENRFIYDLGGGQWNHPKLRELLEEILPKKAELHDYVLEMDFPQIGHKTMLLNARTLQLKSGREQLMILAMEEILPKMSEFHDYALEMDFPQIGHKTMLLNARTLRFKSGREQLIILAMEDITERRSTEELVRQQAFMLDLAEDAIFIRSAEGTLLYWNQGAERLYGWQREEVRGKPVQDILKTVFPKPLEQIKVDLAHKGHWAGELIHTRRDGSRVAVAARWTLQREEGQPMVWLEINTDITALKQATESLRKSHRMFEGLFESSPDGILTIGKGGQITRVNRQVERMFGYDRGELLERPPEVLVPERFKDLHPAHRQGYMAQPRVRAMGAGLDLYARRKDGSEFPVDILLSPLATEEGAQVLAVIRDITDRKRAEQNLRESEARTRTIIESAHDAFIAMTPDGVISDWNRQAEVQFGWSRKEAIGRSLALTIIPPDLRDAHERGLKHFLATGEGSIMNKRVEMRAMHRDGHEFPVELTVYPIRMDHGSFFAAFINDITARKRAETALFLLVQVISQASEAGDVRAVAPQCVETISKLAGWKVGQAWYLDESQNVLRCDRRVHYSEIDDFEFRQASLEMAFAKGQGLPGRVWKAVSSLWISDVQKEVNFGRRSQALSAGLICGFAFPIAVGSKFFGLWEFFSPDSRIPDPHLLESVAKLGKHVAIVYERREAENSLRNLSSRLIKLQDEERRKIARELHDSTSQTLAAIGMNLSVVSEEANALSLNAQKLLSDVGGLVAEASDEVRTMAHLLHPPLLDEVGLISALQWYVDGFVRRSGVKVKLVMPSKLDRLPADVETALFRIVQEGLTNVRRHSGSKSATVTLTANPESIELVIKDQGKGMAAKSSGSHQDAALLHGVGVAGMRERVKQLGGQLDIASGKKGTTVRAVLPAAKAKPVKEKEVPEGK